MEGDGASDMRPNLIDDLPLTGLTNNATQRAARRYIVAATHTSVLRFLYSTGLPIGPKT